MLQKIADIVSKGLLEGCNFSGPMSEGRSSSQADFKGFSSKVVPVSACLQVLEKIMGIVSERAPRGAVAAADQFLGSLGGSGSGGSRRDREPSSSSHRDSGGREDLAEVGLLHCTFCESVVSFSHADMARACAHLYESS